MVRTVHNDLQYSAMMLGGATGNVDGRIVQLLIKNPLCKKVVVLTRRRGLSGLYFWTDGAWTPV